MIIIFALIAAASLPQSLGPAELVADFRARDQALLDAIAPGDRKLWDQALASDALYIDENGSALDRTAFLKQMVALPPGASGSLRIVDYSLRIDGDTATVVHRDAERETFHGAELTAGYLMTETWLRRGGAWKLALVHAYVEAVDPPAIKLPIALQRPMIGKYQMNDLVYVISQDRDHLAGGMQGTPAHALLPESRDIFFVPGRPRQRLIFQYARDGRVTGFIERREGEDMRFIKVAD